MQTIDESKGTYGGITSWTVARVCSEPYRARDGGMRTSSAKREGIPG
jgi:hypothetical protein